MNFTGIVQNVKVFAKPVVTKLSGAAPHILIVGGVIGLVGAGIYACVKTPEAVDILDDVEGAIEDVRNDSERGNTDLARAYICGGGRLVRHYAVPLCVAGLSIVAIFGSHQMMVGRNAALAGALGLMSESYSKYRQGVIEEYGEEVDRRIYEGISEVFGEEVDESGNVKSISVYDPDAAAGVYDIEVNYPIDEFQLAVINDQFTANLTAFKHLTLAEVRRYFHVEPMRHAGVVGWHVEKVVDENGCSELVSPRGGDPYVHMKLIYSDPEHKIWRIRPNVQGYVDDLLQTSLI